MTDRSESIWSAFAPIPVRAALDKELGAAALRVLILIASHADKDGICWPSQAGMARDLGIARPAVNKYVKKLRDLGYIRAQRQTRENGSETSCRYQLIYDTPLYRDDTAPVSSGDTPLYPLGVTPPVTSGSYTQNTSIEHPNNISLPQEAFSLYNQTAQKIGLPLARELTDTRKKKLQVRLQECGGLSGWQKALEKIEASDFCRGMKTDFRADLDFLLKQQSFLRLLEGRYDNLAPRSQIPTDDTRQRQQHENQRLMDELMGNNR